MSRFSAGVFVLLVAATFSAFFVAQELKSRPSLIRVTRITEFFSPNGDGRRDVNRISVVARESDDVTIGIVDADGDPVRRLASNVAARPHQPVRVVWKGHDDQGRRVPDGIYRLRVGLRRQGRSVVVQKAISLDTTAPRPVVRRAEDQPSIISPRGGPVRFRIRGTGRRPPRVALWRTDVEPARRVAQVDDVAGSGVLEWDPSPDGAPAPPGVYLIEAIVRDRAGNDGSSAPGLGGRSPVEVRGQPGVTIRALAAQPPLMPRRAAQPVSFLVDSRGRPYRWQVRRLGRSRAAKDGSSASGEARLTVRAPMGPSGIYLLELRSGSRRIQVPFLVQGPDPAPLLVVVPAISWLGSDRVDDDGDGLPDTLESRGPVRWPRPFAGQDGLPTGFADDVAPLLVSLDRAHIDYDVTTDLALARGDGPRLAGHDGVLLAGSLRWIPRPLALRLRRYAMGGGRVASVGVQSMRRGVTVTPDALVRPTQPSQRDPFGTELLPLRRLSQGEGSPPSELGPLEEAPDLGLFEGSDGVLEGFDVVEESRRPDSGRARLLAALGQPLGDREAARAEEAGRAVREPLPVLAATRLGRGLVIRVGLPQWSQRLVEDPEVEQVNRNIADILRGVRPRVRSGSG